MVTLAQVQQHPSRDAGLDVRVIEVDAQRCGILAEFLRQVWNPEATEIGVREARAFAASVNPVQPGREIPTFLFLIEGRPVGHLSTSPIRLRAGSTEEVAHWTKGLEVLPQYRNGPVGFSLLKHAASALGPALALVVQPAARRLFQALGFRDWGVLPNFLCPLRPTTLLRRLDLNAIDLPGLPGWMTHAVQRMQRGSVAGLVGGGLTLATRTWQSVASPRRSGWTSQSPREPDWNECDALWDRVRGAIPAAAVRDGTYLRWRYVTRAHGEYAFVTVRSRSRLEGLAVVRRPRAIGDSRLNGIQVATLSDLVVAPNEPRSVRATIVAATGVARSLNADALLCSASDRRLANPLRRCGYFRLPGNVHLLTRDVSGRRDLPPELGDWWITRGDSDADEVF